MFDQKLISDEIKQCTDLKSLEEAKKKYIGKKWLISAEFKNLKYLSNEERKNQWELLGSLRSFVEQSVKDRHQTLYMAQTNKQLENDIIDITTEGKKLNVGNFSKIAALRREIEEFFQSMGFEIEYWKDIVTKYQNFFSLNIPATHPATEMHDTFYLEEKDETDQNYVLRTHTSSWQNNLMKKYKAPLRVIIPGKTFRYESTDASHDNTFWQLEWLVIDKDISIANMIDLMEKFFWNIFGNDTQIRLRPAYFPFVEPWFEWDVSCPMCKQKGCSFCKQTWWIEIFGAGMVHPNVLKDWEIDTTKYTWFAFGMWLTRIVAVKYWIWNIRLFNSGDIRFAKAKIW